MELLGESVGIESGATRIAELEEQVRQAEKRADEAEGKLAALRKIMGG